MVILLEGMRKVAAGGGNKTHCRHSDLMGLEHGPGTGIVLSSSSDSDKQAGLRTAAHRAFTYFPSFILYHPAPITLHPPAILASEFPEKVLLLLPGIQSPKALPCNFYLFFSLPPLIGYFPKKPLVSKLGQYPFVMYSENPVLPESITIVTRNCIIIHVCVCHSLDCKVQEFRDHIRGFYHCIPRPKLRSGWQGRLSLRCLLNE